MARCLHRKCGRRFTGVTAFDRHIRYLRQHPWIVCADPAEIGLEWSEARSGWTLAKEGSAAERLSVVRTDEESPSDDSRSNGKVRGAS